jgi:hypothetical protein
MFFSIHKEVGNQEESEQNNFQEESMIQKLK